MDEEVRYLKLEHLSLISNFMREEEIPTEKIEEHPIYDYSENDFAGMKRYLQSQINKHENHPYVKNYYQTRFNELTMATAR